MLSIEQAIKIYDEANPHLKISGILDVGDEWVFSAVDRKTGFDIDSSPLAISKETGAIRVFFPAMNAAKLKHAKLIDLGF